MPSNSLDPVAERPLCVVSCHVERPLDDHVWAAFRRFQSRRPGGFRVAAIIRPPDPASGEDEETWRERARVAARHGPLGHHTHFGGADTARPAAGSTRLGERIAAEAGLFQDSGLAPRFFVGGGWYMDPDVAEVVAQRGYVDCSATCFPHPYLQPSAPRISLAAPAWLRLPSGRRLLELPTTHSLGALVRARARPRRLDGPLVHLFFHDTELLSARRRSALSLALKYLRLSGRPTDLDGVADAWATIAPEESLLSVMLPAAARA
jgi:hypothetical protein